MSTISLSIVIPDVSDVSNLSKKYYTICGSGFPLSSEDYSLWSLAVYEVWETNKIYMHLMLKIHELIYDIQKAKQESDFSKETRKNIGIEMIKIGEAVKMFNFISNESYKIFHAVVELFETNREYDNKYNQVQLTEIYQKIYNDMVQLQVDIQTSKKKDNPSFTTEKNKLLENLKMFKFLGGNASEIESLDRLMDGINVELYWS